jgi:branched-chain amino acid transport system ATP-binding protein
MKAMEIDRVSRYFGKLAAIHDLSFNVNIGDHLAIIGPNGAGKTTLFNILSGYLKPSEGKVYVFGQDISKEPPYQCARLGIGRTFQIINLFPNLTVRQNLQLVFGKKKLNQLFGITRIDEFLKVSELAKSFLLLEKLNSVVNSLSYGDQRVLDIALALFLEPRLMLLDEPTAGLSTEETRIVLDLIRGLSREITLIIIEHDMDVVFEVADRIVVLNYGTVIADGSKNEVRNDPTVREIYLGKGKK